MAAMLALLRGFIQGRPGSLDLRHVSKACGSVGSQPVKLKCEKVVDRGPLLYCGCSFIQWAFHMEACQRGEKEIGRERERAR